MRRRRAFAALGVMGLAACAANAPGETSGGPPTPAPATQTIPEGLPLRYSPGVTRYLITQRHHIENTLPTGNQVQEIGLRTFVTAVITGPADPRGYGLTLTVDSILPDSDSVVATLFDLQAARGLRYEGHLSPAGHLIDPRPSDPTTAKTLSQLFGSFRTFYPRLPSTGIKPGLAWSDTSETTDTTRNGIVRDQSVTRYASGSWESAAGGRQLGINLSEDFTVSGSGEAQGSTFALSGTGTRAGLLQMSATGRFLGGSTTDSAGMVITFDAQGMAIPRRQISHTTITVLP